MQASRQKRGAFYVSTKWWLPNKEFYVLAAVRAAADSRGALTPSNVPRTFSMRLNRFTGTTRQYTSVPSVLHCDVEEVQTF